MQLRQARRTYAKIKMGLQGPSGSGKTMGALFLAFGLCGDWSKVAVVDTENNSADLYAHLGNYQVLGICAPFTPEKYVEAIAVCEKAGMEVIILDSITHEWDGSGGILDMHSAMAGNSFTNWGKLTPRHNGFVEAILQSSSHIIATIRTKQDYVLVDKNGKQVPEKVGLKGVQRDGLDYDFTLVFDIDIKHFASASKDRTSLFIDKPSVQLTVETGKKILDWCNSGKSEKEQTAKIEPLQPEEVKSEIANCKTIGELLALYKQRPEFQQTLMESFVSRRRELESKPSFPNRLNHSNNGTANN
jgi:AAA domain